MEETSQLVSSFVRSLETHPNGEAIIEIVEAILADESGVIDPSHITSLKELSNNNVSLLVDFWILRGTILIEEGRDLEAIQLFFEATQWLPDDVSTWLRIADIFKAKDDLLKASFFLTEAQTRLTPHISVTEKLDSLLSQLEVRLSFPPGIPNLTNGEDNALVDPPRNLESELDGKIALSIIPVSSARPKGSFQIPPEAESVWNLALECFEEGTKGDNLIYLNAFIHYAHSTVREVLGLDGNFKAGLDAKVARYGLFQYQRFFNRLNSLRNAVVHENYLLSKEEAQDIHTQVTEFLAFLQTQQH
ncbi:MAG: tetratricopeptide repeat protein [Candidatus Hodarchaeota archaeon]